MILPSRKEKEAIVIKLAKEGKTYREISKVSHVNPLKIREILYKTTGDADHQHEDKKEKEKHLKKLSPYTYAFQMLKERYEHEYVAIEPDDDANTILHYYSDYLKIKGMDSLVTVYYEIKKNFPLFMHLFRWIQKEGSKRMLLQNC